MRVLITGAAGMIGRHLAASLEKDHDLRLGDIVLPAQGREDDRWNQLDVTCPAQVREAVSGMEAVIHLAIASGHEGDFEDDAFNQLRFDVNVRGTCNVLRAAAEAGVSRFVHTSSLTVVWGYAAPEFVVSDAPARPVGTYALTKHLGEIACGHVAGETGMSVLCLRIPKPIDPDDESWRGRRLRPQWIAMPELIRAYQLALTAEVGGCEIVTVVGESPHRRWDLEKAARVLGYRPEFSLADFGFEIGGEHEELEPR